MVVMWNKSSPVCCWNLLRSPFHIKIISAIIESFKKPIIESLLSSIDDVANTVLADSTVGNIPIIEYIVD